LFHETPPLLNVDCNLLLDQTAMKTPSLPFFINEQRMKQEPIISIEKRKYSVLGIK